jgi:hypothetical protein
LLARLGVKSISVTKYDSTGAMPQDLMGIQVFATSFAARKWTGLARKAVASSNAGLADGLESVTERPPAITVF